MTDKPMRESNGQFAKRNPVGPGRPRSAVTRELQPSMGISAISASALPVRLSGLRTFRYRPGRRAAVLARLARNLL